MFIYLMRALKVYQSHHSLTNQQIKIAIPNCEEGVKCVAWTNPQGYIACGGEKGLLKVLKLENTPAAAVVAPKDVASNNSKSATAPAPTSQLSMNQTLDGHQGTLTLAVWNSQHEKLTTADSNGLIIVWILYKGMWYEEMVNNRNKGLVSGMQWDRSGQRICIVYEDGAVILGGVDGNRIWGKDVKNTTLAHVQWSPDGNFLLFGTVAGQLQLFDHQGTFVSIIPDYCHPTSSSECTRISAIDWYNGAGGFLVPDIPCLAICYEDGMLQIMRSHRDEKPVKIELVVGTGFKKIKMQWNCNGSILAVAGMQTLPGKDGGEEKDTCVVQFWSPFGLFLRSIKIPGNTLSSISWESDGLRIAIAVDSFVFFANIRPDYRWAYFATDVLAYAFNRPDSSQTILNFWNVKTNEKNSKTVDKLLSITGAGDHCVVTTQSNDQYFIQTILTLYNAIGVPIDTKVLDFEPKHIAVAKTNVFCANDSIIFHWQFKQLASVKMTALESLRRKEVKDRAFHIDDMTTIGSNEVSFLSPDLLAKPVTQNHISCIAASDSCLIIARASGEINQYLIPTLSLDNKYNLDLKPVSISLNCNSTRLSILEGTGILHLLELEGAKSSSLPSMGMVAPAPSQAKYPKYAPGTLLDFERKDVWSVKWANDQAELLAIMEKTRLLIFKNTEAEDPIPSSSYICDFENLEVKTALLDDIFKNADAPLPIFLVPVESKPLRELKSIIGNDGFKAAVEYAMENWHPRLWKEIANSALQSLNLDVASNAFVQSQDYQGIQFIKRLNKIEDPKKKQAEAAAFCKDFDAAEKIYIDMDRKDLAVDLRIRLGDWFRVVQLLKTGAGGDDALMEKAWNHIGDYYYERQRWTQAVTYYSQARNTEKLVDLYYLLEDFTNLEKLAAGLSDNSTLLKNVAEKFVSAGLCQPAFNAYMKLGDVAAAIDTCVALNQWSTAISLAETHHFKEIEEFLGQYITHLLSQKRIKEAVELYRKANYCQKSARLLLQLAREAIKDNQSPNIIKKLFVLGALEVERHLSLQRNNKSNPNSALEHLLEVDNTTAAGTSGENISLEKPWRSAEAYHYFMLSQRQFYAGQLELALVTASHLREYDDILSERTIYSLLAIISLHAGYYGTCSNAFLKLESLPFEENMEEEGSPEYYSNLALEIFTRHAPHDPDGEVSVCSNCLVSMKESESQCSSCNMQFPICVASGRVIVEANHFMCHLCKHKAIESEICNFTHCPLCHTVL